MRRRKTYGLLTALVALLGGVPFLDRELAPLVGLLLLLVIANGIYVVSGQRRQLITGLCLMAPAAVFSALELFVTLSDSAVVIGLSSYALALLYLAHIQTRRLLTIRNVTPDTLSVAVSGYLLLGITWAFFFMLAYAVNSGAFKGLTPGESPNEVRRDLFYFSFVTLSTLGYGDIVPATRGARSLAVGEALLGQLYIAITVARLVGLQIAARVEEDVK